MSEEDFTDDLPDRRKHGYKELEEKLEEHAKENKAQLAGFISKSLIAFGIIGLMCTVALAGFGIVLGKLADQSDRAEELAKENRALAVVIQKERRTECENTNLRHDGAVAALIKGSDEDQANAPNEAARKEIRRRRNVTIALLDALAPHQECEDEIKTKPKEKK